MYLSPFQISTYQQCPLKYRFHYLDQLADEFARPRHYFSFGRMVHSTLRDYYRLGGCLENGFQLLKEIYREKWKGIEPEQEGYRNRQQAEDYFHRGYYMLRRFYRQSASESRKTLALEQSLKYEISSGLSLGGRIDRLARSQDGILEVIDYKTGKRVPSEAQLKQDIQPAIYRYLVQQTFQEEEVRIINYYLMKDRVIVLEELALDGEGLKTLALQLQEKIEGGIFPARLNNFCGFCDFRLLCPRPEIEQQLELGSRQRERILELAEAGSKSPLLLLKAGRLVSEGGHDREAILLLEQLLEKEIRLSPLQDFVLSSRLAPLYLKQGRGGEARNMLNRMQKHLKEGLEYPDADYMLEWIELKLEEN